MEINKKFWKGRKVLITGHTGFKGSWLSLWLQSLEVNLFGIALPPSDGLSLFKSANVSNLMEHNILDIRNYIELQKLFDEIRPQIIFHMAAQPLVRKSYRDPIETFQTNILGMLQ